MKKFHFSSIFAGGVENVHFLFPTAGILLYLSCEFWILCPWRSTLRSFLVSATPFCSPLNHWFALSVKTDVSAVGRVEELPCS